MHQNCLRKRVGDKTIITIQQKYETTKRQIYVYTQRNDNRLKIRKPKKCLQQKMRGTGQKIQASRIQWSFKVHTK